MNPVFSLGSLKRYATYSNQHWYYVLLVNVLDPTEAGKKVLECLDYYDIDSGKSCDFFIPGFVNSPDGLLNEKEYSRIKECVEPHLMLSSNSIYIERIGTSPFYPKLFINFYKAIEDEVKYKNKWKYSGRCELLLFSIDKNERINTDDISITRAIRDIIRRHPAFNMMFF